MVKEKPTVYVRLHCELCGQMLIPTNFRSSFDRFTGKETKIIMLECPKLERYIKTEDEMDEAAASGMFVEQVTDNGHDYCCTDWPNYQEMAEHIKNKKTKERS